MAALFRNEMHNDFVWAHGYIPYGGADFGEIRAVAEAVADSGDDAFHDAWVAAGDRMAAAADALLAKGRMTSARETYLRASVFYASSFRPLYGAPVDPRLLSAFRKEVAAFDSALSLGEAPTAPMAIPFGEISLPGYFIPAEGRKNEVRPLIIFTNGYDGTIVDTYFACAVAASRRGYHSLLFDGPGQGAIAAGGIADARGVTAAFALGASAVQVGTAFLLCPEAKTSPVHRAALKRAKDNDMVLTNVLTGRPARGMLNRLVREVGPISEEAPPFPLAAGAVGPLRAKSEAADSGDFSPLWAGQSAALAKEMTAGYLTRMLAIGSDDNTENN